MTNLTSLKRIRRQLLPVFLLSGFSLSGVGFDYLPQLASDSDTYTIQPFDDDVTIDVAEFPDDRSGMTTRSDGVTYEGFYWVPSYFIEEANQTLHLFVLPLNDGKIWSDDWATVDVDMGGINLTGIKCIIFNGLLRIIGGSPSGNANPGFYYQDFRFSGTAGSSTTAAVPKLESTTGSWTLYQPSTTITDFTATVVSSTDNPDGVVYLFYVEAGSDPTIGSSNVFWAVDTGSGFSSQGELVRNLSTGESMGNDVFALDVITYYDEESVTVGEATQTVAKILLATLSGENTGPELAMGSFKPSVTSGTTTISFTETQLTAADLGSSHYEAKGIRLVNGMNSINGSVSPSSSVSSVGNGATMVLTIESWTGDYDIRLNVASFLFSNLDTTDLAFVEGNNNFASGEVSEVLGRVGVGMLQLGTGEVAAFDCSLPASNPTEVTLKTIQEYVVLSGWGFLHLPDDGGANVAASHSSFQLAKGNTLTPVNSAVVSNTSDLDYLITSILESYDSTATDLSDLSSADQTAAQTEANEAVESYVSAWDLVGVIHAAPPFLANSNSANTTAVSLRWDSEESETNSTSLSQSATTSFSSSISGNMPIFSMNDTYSYSTTTASGSTQTSEASVSFGDSISIAFDGAQSSLFETGTLIFLAPTILNQQYAITAHDGTPIDANYFVTWIPCTTVVTQSYNSTDPAADVNIVTSAGVSVSLPIADGMFAVAGGSDSFTDWENPQYSITCPSGDTCQIKGGSFAISQTTPVAGQATQVMSFSTTSGSGTSATTTNTSSNSTNLDISKSARGFGFNVSDTWTDSDSTTDSIASTVSKYFTSSISVTMSSTYASSSGSWTDNVAGLTFDPYLVLAPEPGDGNWTPTGHSGNNPFLITWIVTNTVAPTTTATDSDGDGLADEYETELYGTNPDEADSDGDGLDDLEEVIQYGTGANNVDSDGDLYSDFYEVTHLYDPLDSAKSPSFATSVTNDTGAVSAATFSFPSQLSKSYRIEYSRDMVRWYSLEAGIPGTGDEVSRSYMLFPGEGLFILVFEE